jgi:hypothetical protein
MARASCFSPSGAEGLAPQSNATSHSLLDPSCLRVTAKALRAKRLSWRGTHAPGGAPRAKEMPRRITRFHRAHLRACPEHRRREVQKLTGGMGVSPRFLSFFGVGAEQRRAMRSKRGERQERIIFMGVPHGPAGHHPEMKMDLCWLFSDQARRPKQSHEASLTLLGRLLQAPPSQRRELRPRPLSIHDRLPFVLTQLR